MATLSDVAARAGVSVSAASRVLSDAPSARVSAATRERIHQAARELGYRPNFIARALRSARLQIVALVVPDLTNAVFTELLTGVEREAAERGYMVMLARSENLLDEREGLARLIGEGRIDGMIVQVGDAMEPGALDALVASGLPVVFANSSHPSTAGSVELDDERGAALAVEHLVGLGHRSIGLINGVPTSDTAVRRGRGFRSAMAAAGLEVDERLVTNLGYTTAQGGEGLRRILAAAAAAQPAAPTPPTAVVVANVNAALGVLLAAREAGIRVPDALSVVAMHDALTAEFAWPPLTTVRMPLRELGRAAMAELASAIAGGEVHQRVVDDPAPVMVVRESTAPPAAPTIAD